MTETNTPARLCETTTTSTTPTIAVGEVENFIRSILDGQHSSASIEFNGHACNYCTVGEAIDRGLYEHAQWISDEEREKAIANNWAVTVQWYPDTPVGFYCVAASSLQACLDAIKADRDEEEQQS